MLRLERFIMKRHLLIVTILLTCNGCVHYTYFPGMPAENFYEKDDLKLKGTGSTMHFEGQASYAPSKFLGVSSGGFIGSLGNKGLNLAVASFGSLPLGQNKRLGYTMNVGGEMAALGGSATYRGYNGYRKEAYRYNLNYSGIFFQPSLWIRISRESKKKAEKNSYFAIGSKVNYIQYQRFSYDFYDYVYDVWTEVKTNPFQYRMASLYFAWELQVDRKTRFPAFLCGLQAGYHHPLSGQIDAIRHLGANRPTVKNAMVYNPIILNFYLGLRINTNSRTAVRK